MFYEDLVADSALYLRLLFDFLGQIQVSLSIRPDDTTKGWLNGIPRWRDCFMQIFPEDNG